MNRKILLAALVPLFLAYAGLAAEACHTPTAAAQDVGRDDALDLARCIVAEAGPKASADAAAILHVLERRSTLRAWRGQNAAAVARRYCVALSGRARNARALRVRALAREEVPPALLVMTERWLAGDRPPDPCGGLAWDWDGRQHAGREPVDCGWTDNVFFGRAR